MVLLQDLPDTQLVEQTDHRDQEAHSSPASLSVFRLLYIHQSWQKFRL